MLTTMDTTTTKNENEKESKKEGEKERQPSVASISSTVLMSEYACSDEGGAGAACKEGAYGSASELVASVVPALERANSENYGNERAFSSAQQNRAISEPFLETASLVNDLHNNTQYESMTCNTQHESIICTLNPMDLLVGSPNKDDLVKTKNEEIISVLDEDMLSVSESTGSIKRKRNFKRRRSAVESDSDVEIDEVGMSQRLRSNKARLVEMTTKNENENDLSPNTVSFSSCVASAAGDTDESTLIESEPGRVDRKGKKKTTRRKQSPIANKLHTTIDLEELEELSTAVLITHAIEWIEDIDRMRARSNLQGVISKYTKERLELIKGCFNTLHGQSLGANDPGQLKLRNARLAADLCAAQKEILQLRHNLKQQAPAKDRPETCDVGTSPSDNKNDDDKRYETPKRVVDEIIEIKNSISQLESNLHDSSTTALNSLPLPVPQRQQAKPIIKSVVELPPERRVIIRDKSTFAN